MTAVSRRLTLALMLASALLAGLAQASPAFAHASLLRSEPANGAIVAHAPDALKLVFNEPVSPLVFRLIGANGHGLDLANVVSDGATIVAALPAGLGHGTHLVSWRAVSADGHPVGGSFTFSVGDRSAGAFAAPSSQSDLSVRVALWALKLVLYLGLFVGIGGAFYRAFVTTRLEPAAQRAILTALIGGTLAAMMSVGVQGLDALARPLTELFNNDVWKAGLATSYKRTAEFATWSMIAALLSTQAARPLPGKILAAAALAGTGVALAASGHAGNAEPQWLMRGAVFIHAAGVAFWIGALPPLLMALRAGRDVLPELRLFGRMMAPVLVAMLAAGFWLAFIQIGRVEALWTTAYGLILSAKLAAVTLLLGLAALNRFHLVSRLERGEAAGRTLAASIGGEIAIMLVILALVAAWRFTPPPRVLAAAAAEPVFVHFHTNEAMAEFTLDPIRGRQTVTLQILNGEFGPLTAKEVEFVLSKPDAGIEPLRWKASHVQAGAWRVENVQIPLGGRWRARVEILINDFERIGIEDAVELPP